MTGRVKAGGNGRMKSRLLTPTGGVVHPDPDLRATGSVFWSGGKQNGKSEIALLERDTVLCAM